MSAMATVARESAGPVREALTDRAAAANRSEGLAVRRDDALVPLEAVPGLAAQIPHTLIVLPTQMDP